MIQTPCVVYTRVSSEEQAKVGYSIPFQRARLEQHAADRQLDVVARFEDIHSAKQQGRPSFDEMLRFFEQNPHVRTVLVHRLDRLVRNHSDYGMLVEQMGIRVLSVVEPVEDSPSGRLQHGVGVVMARYHSDNLTLEVKKGMRAKFEAGGLPGKAPPGYRNVPKTKTTKGIIVLDERAAAVRAAFERYAAGNVGLRSVAFELFDHGVQTSTGKPLSPQKVHNMLASPVYAGQVQFLGDVRPGTHPRLVDDELFARVQKVLRRRNNHRGEAADRFFLLRGFLWCARCTRRMTAEAHGDHGYYRCLPAVDGTKCHSPYVADATARTQVEALLALVELSSTAMAAALAALEDDEIRRQELRRTEEPELLATRARLQAKQQRLVEMCADGTLARDEFRTLRGAVEAELRVVDDRVDALSATAATDIEQRRRSIYIAASLVELYRGCASDDDRKEHLRQVIDRIDVVDRSFIGVRFTPPFEGLLRMPNLRDDGNAQHSETPVAA
jgi:DNA invertase Pin-like site-specific DNA recombinase